MRVKSRMANLVYMIILTLISGYGVFLALGIHRGEFKFFPLYYTNLSNMICFVYFFACVIKGIGVIATKQPSYVNMTVLPRFKGSIVMCITVTFLIYHFLLFNGSFYTPGTTNIAWLNIIQHYLVPTMVILHWIIFDEKGVFKKKDPFIWLIIPVIYMVYAFVNAEIGTIHFDNNKHRYPYFFINPDLVGWRSVVIYVLVLFVFFIVLGYIIVLLDKLMAKKAKK